MGVDEVGFASDNILPGAALTGVGLELEIVVVVDVAELTVLFDSIIKVAGVDEDINRNSRS